jgi:hypothetical protein
MLVYVAPPSRAVWYVGAPTLFWDFGMAQLEQRGSIASGMQIISIMFAFDRGFSPRGSHNWLATE